MSVLDHIKGMRDDEFHALCIDLVRAMGLAVRSSAYREGEVAVDASMVSPGGVERFILVFLRKDEVGLDALRETEELDTVEAKWVVITTGKFTPEAVEYGKDRGITLVDGDAFVEMLRTYGLESRVKEEEFRKKVREGSFLPSAGEYDRQIEWAREFLESGNYRKADEYVERALAVKRTPEALLIKGKILFNMGREEEAVEYVSEAIDLSPDDPVIWFQFGEMLQEKGMEDEALEAYERALRIDRDYYPAWINKGLILHSRGLLEEALICYENALRVAPNLPHVWNNRGVALKDLGRKDEALMSYDRALSIDPKFYEAHLNKAILYYESRAYQRALNSAYYCTRLREGDPRGWAVLAMTQYELGDYAEALKSVEKALTLAPTDPDLRELKEKIEKKHRRTEEEREKNLQRELEEKERELEAVRRAKEKEMAELQRKLEEREKTLSQLEREKEELKRRIEEMQRAVEEGRESEGEVEALKEKLASLENERRKLVEKVVSFLRERGVEVPENVYEMSPAEILELQLRALEGMKPAGGDEEVLKKYDEILAERPGDSRVLFSKALYLYSEGRLEEALEPLEAILSAGESDAARLLYEKIRSELGGIKELSGNEAMLYLNLDRCDDVVEGVPPTSSDALAQLARGIALYVKGDVEGAKEAFKRAVAIDPGMEEARLNLNFLEGS